LPQSALGWAVLEMGNWEEETKGVQWTNFFKPAHPGDVSQFTFATSMYMMAIDIVMYILLAAYIEAVLPGRHDRTGGTCTFYRHVRYSSTILLSIPAVLLVPGQVRA
jgi:hypothetical protein